MIPNDHKDPEKGTTTAVVPVDNAAEQHTIHLADVDAAARLVAGFDREITPEEEKRVLRKIDRRLLPLM